MRKGKVPVIMLTTLALGLSLFVWSVVDNLRFLTLDVVMVDGDFEDVTTNPVETTTQACGTAISCVEAYSTSEADYYRFPSQKRASNFAKTLEDGFHNHYIVMDFSGKRDVSREQQQWAIEHLLGIWQDYEGTGSERQGRTEHPITEPGSVKLQLFNSPAGNSPSAG